MQASSESLHPLSVERGLAKWIVAGYTILLTYLLLAPHPLWILGATGQSTEEAIDNTLSGQLQHVLAYGVFYGLVAWLLHPSRPRQFYGGLLVLAHGLVAEWAQQFVPFRHADAVDMLANAIGAGTGWGLWCAWRSVWK